MKIEVVPWSRKLEQAKNKVLASRVKGKVPKIVPDSVANRAESPTGKVNVVRTFTLPPVFEKIVKDDAGIVKEEKASKEKPKAEERLTTAKIKEKNWNGGID